MRTLVSLLLFSICFFLLSPGWAQPLAVPSLSGPVIDETGVLQPYEIQELATLARTRKTQGLGQVQILVIKTLNSETIEEYANRVFHTWKLGKKGVDDGVLILVALYDHKMRIEVGRGLEGAIPDAFAKRITADEMAPYFKNAQFFEGLKKGVYTVNRLIDGEKAVFGAHPECAYEAFGFCLLKEGLSSSAKSLLFLGLFLTLFFIFMYRTLRRMKTELSTSNQRYDNSTYDQDPLRNNSSSSFDSSSIFDSSSSSSGGDWSGGGGDSGGGGASSDW